MTNYTRLLAQYQKDVDELMIELVKEGLDILDACSIVYGTYKEMGILL